MKFTKESLKLYVITDRSWIGNRSMSEEVEKTLKAGATCLQIREKNISYDEYVSKSIELRKICNKYNVPFIVNDNIEVALASGADGVHVGQNDILNKNVRSIIGSDKILGISVNSIELAIGINEQNIPILKGIGIAGVAVISAVFGKEDVAEATYKLRKLVDEYI